MVAVVVYNHQAEQQTNHQQQQRLVVREPPPAQSLLFDPLAICKQISVAGFYSAGAARASAAAPVFAEIWE